MTRVSSTFGGSAAAGGFGFQANIGAIAGVHTLRGTSVQWTDGLAGAAPCAVSFETSGPGDDLSMELAGRQHRGDSGQEGTAGRWAILVRCRCPVRRNPL